MRFQQHSGAHFIDCWSHWQKVLKSIILEGLLAPRPESAQIDHSGIHFVDFWSLLQKVLKSIILEHILYTSGAIGRKCSNRSFWNSFYRLLEPRAESAQIAHSGAHAIDFWSQGQKVLKSSILELILLTSGAIGRNCSNLSFRSSFCRLLEPLAESAKIYHSGAHFVDFWSQGQKVFKSSILGASGGIWLNLWMCVHTLERLILQTLQSVVQK